MTWTPPRTWATNEVDTAAFLNAQIRDNSKALITACRTFKNYTSGGAGFANGSSNIVVWDGYILDPLGMATTSTRITAPIAGWYTVRGVACGFASAGFTAKVFKNGSLILTGTTGTSDSTVGEYDLQLVATDYLELVVVVNAGAGGFGWSPSPVAEHSIYLPDQAIFTIADLKVDWVGP